MKKIYVGLLIFLVSVSFLFGYSPVVAASNGYTVEIIYTAEPIYDIDSLFKRAQNMNNDDPGAGNYSLKIKTHDLPTDFKEISTVQLVKISKINNEIVNDYIAATIVYAEPQINKFLVTPMTTGAGYGGIYTVAVVSICNYSSIQDPNGSSYLRKINNAQGYIVNNSSNYTVTSMEVGYGRLFVWIGKFYKCESKE